jgi:hypothetical protein
MLHKRTIWQRLSDFDSFPSTPPNQCAAVVIVIVMVMAPFWNTSTRPHYQSLTEGRPA